MIHDWSDAAANVLVLTVGFTVRSYVHYLRDRMATLEKRVKLVEAINQAVAARHLTTSEIDIITLVSRND